MGVLTIVGIGAAALLLALLVARARFGAFVAGFEAKLGRTRPVPVTDRLPPRVREFAQRCDASADDIAARVHLTQLAELQREPGGPWYWLEARQTIATGEPGFVWEGWRPFCGTTKVRVVDSFVNGAGRLRVQILGLVRIIEAKGADVDRGEAMRYLAELPWAPDAILGNPSVSWRMEDEDHAVATLEAAGGPVSVRFRFDGAGDIVEFFAKDRPKLQPGGGVVLCDWRGYFRNYRMIGTRRIPSEGEVGYVEGGVYDAYFQGRVTSYEIDH
ncbi:DUF6544 family protein [Psychromarinibacter halotolerans]|uniref:DUF6544 family protein n=1 Tax=Psychromarinibacter halotolerans TaxID=1775175 RepID=A0ABV7H3E7_9RHOB|nr:DUF6544 family protein [Psychromarinibacter halotolerans]MDF0598584.1 hypothetical protein [Psychromarinibacter halotolerans]